MPGLHASGSNTPGHPDRMVQVLLVLFVIVSALMRVVSVSERRSKLNRRAQHSHPDKNLNPKTNS